MKNVKCNYCNANLIRKNPPSMAHIKVFYCNLKCKSEFQKLAKPVNKAWLEKKYLIEKLDCVEISKIVKRDAKSVWNWLKDFGIPTRPRGIATAKHIRGKSNANLGKKHTPEFCARLSQIAISQKRVPFDPKIGSYMKGRKGPDTPNWKGGCTPLRAAFYSTKEWKFIAPKVWVRDNATCQKCGKKQGKKRAYGEFDIHHIKSFQDEKLRCHIDNLVLLCEPCHYWVHSRKNKDKEFLK